MEALQPKSGNTFITIIATVEFILIGVSGYYLSILVGNKDTSNDLSKTLLPVTGILGAIVMLHTLLWYTYFTYHPLSMNLYFLMSSAVTMVISLIALSISLIQKQ